jgi:uncharacterized protein
MSKAMDWDKITEIFSATPNVVAAWVFGSAQAGEIPPGGDLDIGVLFDSLPTLDELALLRSELQINTQIEDIDLVVLNQAAALLRFEAVLGRLVFGGDSAQMVEFVSLAAREYESERAFMNSGMRLRKEMTVTTSIPREPSNL